MAALPHTKTPEALAQEFHVDLNRGLSDKQAHAQQLQYGRNGALCLREPYSHESQR